MNYIAIDQYGHIYRLPPMEKDCPRKALCEFFGTESAKKMYVDGKDEKPYHIGYIIGNRWLTLYQLVPFRKEAK